MCVVVGIAIKPEKKAPMQPVNQVVITVADGLRGDCRGSRERAGGRRQVTLISLDQWQDACDMVNANLPWHARRANICVAGINFGPESVGRKIHLGDAVLEITGETKPCERMDAIHPGLKAALALDWRGGVTCRVERGAPIQVGNVVR